MHRLYRFSATPHSIALGFSFGAFVSFTPFIGFHLALCTALAYLFRGHLIAAVIGTFVGNPLTFPFIWLFIYDLGYRMVGDTWLASQATIETSQGLLDVVTGSFDQAMPVILTMAVGGILPGILVGVLCYGAVRMGVAAFQQNRRRHLATTAIRRVRVAKLMAPSAG